MTLHVGTSGWAYMVAVAVVFVLVACEPERDRSITEMSPSPSVGEMSTPPIQQGFADCFQAEPRDPTLPSGVQLTGLEHSYRNDFMTAKLFTAKPIPKRLPNGIEEMRWSVGNQKAPRKFRAIQLTLNKDGFRLTTNYLDLDYGGSAQGEGDMQTFKISRRHIDFRFDALTYEPSGQWTATSEATGLDEIFTDEIAC